MHKKYIIRLKAEEREICNETIRSRHQRENQAHQDLVERP